jgi:hypothetical protein
VYAATLEGSMTDDEKLTQRRIPATSLDPESVNAAIVNLAERYVTAFAPVVDALGQVAQTLGSAWRQAQQRSEHSRG